MYWGPFIVLLLHAVVLLFLLLNLVRRVPILWRRRRQHNIYAYLRLLNVSGTLVLGAVVIWDSLRWWGATFQGRSLIGPAEESWPWDIVIWGAVVVVVVLAFVVRRRVQAELEEGG